MDAEPVLSIGKIVSDVLVRLSSKQEAVPNQSVRTA